MPSNLLPSDVGFVKSILVPARGQTRESFQLRVTQDYWGQTFEEIPEHLERTGHPAKWLPTTWKTPVNKRLERFAAGAHLPLNTIIDLFWQKSEREQEMQEIEVAEKKIKIESDKRQ